jgi:hypothetical protein
MRSWGTQDYGLIFASEIGTPMDLDHFSRSFSRLCQRAGDDDDGAAGALVPVG